MWRDFLSILQKHPQLNAMFSTLLKSRADIMSKAGTAFGGNRKHYEIFGWPVAPDYDYYDHLYHRGGIAKRVVLAYPQATWRTHPTISEIDSPDDEETEFEAAWKELVEKRRVFHYLDRVDRLARLGQFAVLFLGYADGSDWNTLNQPIGMMDPNKKPWEKLLYIQPYAENKVQINQWDENPRSERYGKPTIYQIQLSTPTSGVSNRTVNIHWSRVLHVAEDLMEDDLFGEPCLKPILNYLIDLEKVHGASAEAFYQQSPPLTVFSADKDANIDADSWGDSEMETQVENFINGYKRWLATQGMNVHSLSPQIGDPSNAKEMLLELISGTTGIPKRILIGSERGELASTQDETAWNSRIEERQMNWAEPMVLRQFVDQMVEKGVLPVPAKGYSVTWTGNQSMSEDMQATIAQRLSDALAKYSATTQSQEIVPPEIFLKSILQLDPEVVDQIKETMEDLWEKEQEEMRKDEEELAKEELKKREILGEGPQRPPVSPNPVEQ